MTTSDGRQQIFEAMRKCCETRSRILENFTHTRNLMTAMNNFYNPSPPADALITEENATGTEKEVASIFVNKFGNFPIEFPPCNSLSDQARRDLASGLVSLRADIVPVFGTPHSPRIQSRRDLLNAIIEAMDHCAQMQCSSEIHTEISRYSMTPDSLQRVTLEAVREHKQELRDQLFTAMRQCTAFPISTQALMDAIYYVIQGKCDFTLVDATDEEVQVASSFMNRLFKFLPISPDCPLDHYAVDRLRRFSFGLSALRIEILPHLVDITNFHFHNKLKSLWELEDKSRENFFFRFSGENPDQDIDEVCPSRCPKCILNREHWDRDSDGRRICLQCHRKMRLQLALTSISIRFTRGTIHRFPYVLQDSRTGQLKYEALTMRERIRWDLTVQLRDEYSLTD